jgi:hypothetical protein
MKNKDDFDKQQEMYGKGCLSYSCVGKWTKTFREGCTSLADDLRSRKLPVPDGVESICANIECEPYQSDSTMARELGLSKTCALEVCKKVFKLQKCSLRWVAHTLNDHQKLPRLK